ncbi:MAG TPA: hypothetical protein VFE58_10850 [Tepidisphaeraceae bacterium]|jgi:hypothetical protein|nr:hypothetical protein [Tepidisphaeraceae bacterium]
MPKQSTPALNYLSLISDRIAAIRSDLPHLIKLGQKMADHLLAGGDIFTPPIAPFWPNEFGNRAGGMMGIRSLDRIDPKNKNNVAYFAIPASKTWNAKPDEKLRKLIDSTANLFVIGRYEDLQNVAPKSRFAGFTGGAPTDAGLYATGPHKPLASLREFDIFVRGWITAGEMIAACTRAGRMPIIWMSVWLEGALPRNAHFFTHDNLREPWDTPLFHHGQYVPPLAPGRVANEFLAELQMIHTRLVDQAPALATAGKWLTAAARAGKRTWTVAVGHSYPELLELSPESHTYPIHWGQSLSDLSKAIPAEYGAGDVALHFGYAPVDNTNVQGLLNRGLKLIHTSPYGNAMTPLKHKNFLYFDLPWRPADATIDIPGYSVRILPMSSSAQTMALFSILSEHAEGMGWK